jgi:hypothetical protein
MTVTWNSHESMWPGAALIYLFSRVPARWLDALGQIYFDQ